MSSENIEKKCLYWLNLAQSYILVGDIKNALRTYFLINQAFINPVVNKYPKGAPVSINSGVNPGPKEFRGNPGLKVRGILNTNKNNKVFVSALEGICQLLIFHEADYLRALKYINEILLIRPNSPTAFYLLGCSQFYTGLYNDAVFSLQKALHLFKKPLENEHLQEPYDQTLLVNILAELGRCLFKLAKSSEGIESLTEALEILPKHLPTLLYLEKYFLLRNDLPKAVYYHLQQNVNYPEDEINNLKQVITLPADHPDYINLFRQRLEELIELVLWTDDERDEMREMLNFYSV